MTELGKPEPKDINFQQKPSVVPNTSSINSESIPGAPDFGLASPKVTLTERLRTIKSTQALPDDVRDALLELKKTGRFGELLPVEASLAEAVLASDSDHAATFKGLSSSLGRPIAHVRSITESILKRTSEERNRSFSEIARSLEEAVQVRTPTEVVTKVAQKPSPKRKKEVIQRGEPLEGGEYPWGELEKLSIKPKTIAVLERFQITQADLEESIREHGNLSGLNPFFRKSVPPLDLRSLERKVKEEIRQADWPYITGEVLWQYSNLGNIFTTHQAMSRMGIKISEKEIRDIFLEHGLPSASHKEELVIIPRKDGKPGIRVWKHNK